MTMTMTTDRRHVAGLTSVLEKRTRPLADLIDVRVDRANPDSDPQFRGHAAVFNSRTTIGNPMTWGFYENLDAGTFTKTLEEGDARFLVDHNTALLIARVSAGDLTLREDATGLDVAADLDQELSYVRDLTRNLEKRRITGMSFGFFVVRDEWTTLEVDVTDPDTGDTAKAKADLRTILEVRLLEVSAVTFPAYEETDAGLRAATSEIRAARGVPVRTDLPSQREEGRPAPPDEGTQGEHHDEPAPPEEGTRGTTRPDLLHRYELAKLRRR